MILGNNKTLLLNQVKSQPNFPIEKLKQLLDTYEDLSITDFRGVINEQLYQDLESACIDPNEKASWDALAQAFPSTVDEANKLLSQIKEFIDQYPESKFIEKARSKQTEWNRKKRELEEKASWEPLAQAFPFTLDDANKLLSQIELFINQYPESKFIEEARSKQTEWNEKKRELEEEEIRISVKKKQEEQAKLEQEAWNNLQTGNYNELRKYLGKFPNSVHLAELEEYMWNLTKTIPEHRSFNRFLSDWPNGKRADEARKAIEELDTWKRIKHSNNLFQVNDYRNGHPDSVFKNEIDKVYYDLRDSELNKMKEKPWECGKEYVEGLINHGIFELWQLEDEGLMTEESWEATKMPLDLLPNIQDYQVENEHIQAPEDCTDVYLFGTPGTGKTCLLMGLSGANGKGYTLNMKAAGGPYASALQQYVLAGKTPGHTFGHFVTVINGNIEEENKKGSIYDHPINLVEMSGEEFAKRIADGESVALAHMGTGATNLMCNNNRKIFFLIVDASTDKIMVEYLEEVKNERGEVIDQRIRKKYISQLDILNKFVGLFALPENKAIMEKVDAIHFVVTKADIFGDGQEREAKARELLLNTYSGPVANLKTFCRKNRRINYATNYKPQLYTFSLGKFYLGDVFSFKPEETIKIVKAISAISAGTREKTWWDSVKEFIG